MNVPSLTLSQAVASLQLACQNMGQMELVADRLALPVIAAGDLSQWNLSEEAVRRLGHLCRGRVIGEAETRHALALLAARVGEREMPAVREEMVTSNGSDTSCLDALRQLMPSVSPGAAPKLGFWSRMKDPTDGFSPFMTEQGTRVAFFSSPESLGAWSAIAQRYWRNGVGLVTFLHEKTGTCGMIFVHGIGRTSWSRPERHLWHSSGGSMVFPKERLGFKTALKRVIDEGAAMTLQWRSIDESIKRLSCKNITGIGGSKGILIYGKNTRGLARALEVYGEVLSVLGIALTGSDEGLDGEATDHLAKTAPLNILGTSAAHYRGYRPTAHLAEGVRNALEKAHEKLLKGREAPVLMLGYGGAGSTLHHQLSENRKIPVSGIVDRDIERLVDLRTRAPRLPLFLDGSESPPSSLDRLSLRWNKIQAFDGIAPIVEASHQAAILSPNDAPHPITFDVASSLLTGGIRVVVGSAPQQAGAGTDASSDAIAWILQAGGIFHAADFVVNKLGAAAGISNAIVLGFSQLQGIVSGVAASVEEEIEYAYKRGIPPVIYERERAARAWNNLLSAGEAKGGRFPES